ncbi:MAG TPA: EF-P lysine aminoacylase EpmA [Pirellulales bacterium]|jgi:lysyl-tRNA synthetase class 2
MNEDNCDKRHATVPDNWRPTASWDMLRRRAALLTRLRAFFECRGFLEVETPLLSADTVVDRHLDPFAVPVARSQDSGSPSSFWLQTSPEFAMKRLLAAGGEAIFQVAHAFRSDESGALHNPEFTLVEWYRRGDTMTVGMRLLSELCQELLATPPAVPLTYQDAFQRHVGIDPHAATTEELIAAVRHRKIAAPESLATDDRDSWLDLLLVSLVEPHLGHDAPVLLQDYPPSQAALAIIRDGNPPVAERFELYVRGIELANGYHELLDPAALRERNQVNNAARRIEGKELLPVDSRLLAAMEAGLPAATGVALGFDRMVMLAVGAQHIADVMAFPFDRA